MYKLLIFISIFIITACTHHEYETVVIYGKDQTGNVISGGMGVKYTDTNILTSAHVVSDDRLIYESLGTRYSVLSRDIHRDRAVLTSDSGLATDVPILVDPIVGERVFTEVSRSGSMVILSGVVTAIGASVVGYAPHGGVIDLSGIVLTDMILSPGDSGAPIYNSKMELIDLVHIK